MPDIPPPPPPNVILAQLLFGKVISMSISVVAQLRIADKLADGPMTIADLARETGTHERSLYRVMRCLAMAGVFTSDSLGKFKLTPVGEFLRTGVPGSMRGMADYCGEKWSWHAWGALMESVRTGKTAFDHVFGEPVFNYLGKPEHKAESEVFNEGMTGFSSVVAEQVAKVYNFKPYKALVDVGGGHGIVLATILKANPHARGIVFDAPHVVAGAKGLPANCTTAGGDFFQAVPGGGDCYVMKNIIHDWPDDKSLAILHNIRKVIAPTGKLLLLECVVSPGDTPDFAKILDLEMLTIASGQERTEEEFRLLLSAAGFKLTRVIPTESPICIVEAEPV